MSTTTIPAPVGRCAITLALVATLLIAAPLTGAAPEADATPDLATIDRYVEEQRQAQRIPGVALGIVQDGEIVHVRGYGAADGTGRAVMAQTPFIIGSLTKSFTALAVMQLVEPGKLELDAPVQRYLPASGRPTRRPRRTVRHLLYQTSGLPARAGNEGIASGDASDRALERGARAALRPTQSPGRRRPRAQQRQLHRSGAAGAVGRRPELRGVYPGAHPAASGHAPVVHV